MNNNMNREERRRRIMERGSDRMALITGRLPSLVPSTPPPSPTSYPSFPNYDNINGGSENKQITKEVSDRKEEKDGNIGSQVESHQQQEYKNKTQPSLESSSTPKIKQRPKFFSSRRLNSSIIASETTRVFCALTIAFLVVLSNVDHPLFGRNIVRSKSVVATRPLYIILLTDVTIVIARLHLENRRALEDEGEEPEEVLRIRDDGQDWTQTFKFLERGLVVYQAIRGIFIDRSVYAVAVICGLSLVM